MIFLLSLLSISLGAELLQQQFISFMRTQHLTYPRAEMKLRLRLYQKSMATLQLHNSIPDRKYDMGLNFFTALTPAEKQAYLGLGNVSDIANVPITTNLKTALTSEPDSIDHTKLRHVTAVKNQGGCGSCWAFGGAASFEGSYAITTGNLKNFAEQELLDCSYSDSRDGCAGGWYDDAWKYIGKSKRLGLTSSIPYRGKDGACKYSNKANGASDIVYKSFVRVAPGDDNLVAATAAYVPAVAITVENDFFGYNNGLYDGCNVDKSVNHAVTLVGYEIGMWKVKNSWGAGWGEGGYVRFAREKHSICHISDYAMYPIIAKAPFPWYRITRKTGTVNVPAGTKLVRMRVKCQADGIHERIKLFTYNSGQTAHVELITSGRDNTQFSLFCKGAGRRRWYGGARYFGRVISNAERGACDGEGFRVYKFVQTSSKYQAYVNGKLMDEFSSQRRGRCHIPYKTVSFEVAYAPEAYYQFGK